MFACKSVTYKKQPAQVVEEHILDDFLRHYYKIFTLISVPVALPGGSLEDSTMNF